MRIFLLAFALLATGACAQTPAASVAGRAKSDWVNVQVLSPGTNIHLKTINHGNVRCAVNSTDATSVTCGGVKFDQSTIRYIKSSHRLRSTLVGFGVGYGAAIAVTAIGSEHCRNFNCSGGYLAFIGLFDVGAFIATPIVFGVADLTAGTIYKNPAYN
jgi:hypothetical protein